MRNFDKFAASLFRSDSLNALEQMNDTHTHTLNNNNNERIVLLTVNVVSNKFLGSQALKMDLINEFVSLYD
jgi:hypothetical protein